MKEFFENLKQIRESKGLTLEEISRRSKLSLKFLLEIEKGQLENLPRGYDRIFFKRYLKEIGEDKEEVWRDFNLFFGTGPLEKDVPYSSDIPEKEKAPEIIDEDKISEEEMPPKQSFFQKLVMHLNMDKVHRYFWAVVTVGILAVVGYFSYQQYLFVKNSPPEIKEISVSKYISEMQQQDSLLTPQMSKDTEIASQSDSNFTVKLRARERTWVREIRDQKDTTDYILIAGLKRNISANRSVRLMLGRADGVDIWVNNDSLGVMGTADEVVVSLVLTPEGITEKRLKKPVEKKETTADSTAMTTGTASVETVPQNRESGD
jgi:cytoskeletal protein RodZ